MKAIGTVLPTRKSLAVSDRYAKRVEELQERIGKKIQNVSRRVVGCEVRWYRNDCEYALVDRGGVVRWFELREDGHWYGKRP